jgi:hypothetical protein
MNANKRESKVLYDWLVRGLLIVVLTAVSWAQTLKPIFPSDSKDPRQSGGAALLEAYCPGRVVVGEEIGCRGPCPEVAAFGGEDLGQSISAVTRGHFLSAQNDDAVLSMSGCEPHSENFGGTVLLTRRSQKWTMLWYKAGVDTSQCHKVKLRDGREILVCLGGWGAQGIVETQLYVEDLRAPKPAGMAGEDSVFFSLADDTGTCGSDLINELKATPLTHAYIEKVDFGKGNRGVPAISVVAHSGTREMTLQDVNACLDEQNPNKPRKGLSFLPPTKPERIDLVFEGGTYHRSSESRE